VLEKVVSIVNDQQWQRRASLKPGWKIQMVMTSTAEHVGGHPDFVKLAGPWW
jgi:hypothetical protein